MGIDELSQQIAAYRRGSSSLDAFEDWFRSNSRGMFGESAEILNACIAVEEAFSELRDFGDLDQFRRELDNAIRPFVQGDGGRVAFSSIDKPPQGFGRTEIPVEAFSSTAVQRKPVASALSAYSETAINRVRAAAVGTA